MSGFRVQAFGCRNLMLRILCFEGCRGLPTHQNRLSSILCGDSFVPSIEQDHILPVDTVFYKNSMSGFHHQKYLPMSAPRIFGVCSIKATRTAHKSDTCYSHIDFLDRC